jgi:hypothetical protein
MARGLASRTACAPALTTAAAKAKKPRRMRPAGFAAPGLKGQIVDMTDCQGWLRPQLQRRHAI